MQLIQGKIIADQIKEEIAAEVKQLLGSCVFCCLWLWASWLLYYLLVLLTLIWVLHLARRKVAWAEKVCEIGASPT